jgi:hypothetical protein
MRKPESLSSSRTSNRRVSCAARQALCLAVLLALPGSAQNAPLQPTGGLGPSGPHLHDPFSEAQDQYQPREEKQLRALNAERQKLLVADTNKLLKLAAELDAEVSRDHPGALTVDQLRKLAEIEKLAHSVKDKMSTSVRGTPLYSPSFSPVVQ